MEARVLEELLHRQPFAPFRLKLSNQQTIDVINPSLVVVMKREVFIADTSRDFFHIFALLRVVGVEWMQSR